MAILSGLLAFLGVAQHVPAVEEAEAEIVKETIGLVEHLFGWIESKESGHPLILAATMKVQNLIEEHGEEDLIAFLASKGIHVSVAPPTAAPATMPPGPEST